MNQFNNFCIKISHSKISLFKFILFVIIFNLLLSLLFSFITNHFFSRPLRDGFKDDFGSSLQEKALVLIVFIPLLETILFQYAIIETANKKFSPFISCIISAFFFGLIHSYNLFYVIITFIMGFLLATIYNIASINKRGILYTLLTHMLCNAIVFIVTEFNH